MVNTNIKIHDNQPYISKNNLYVACHNHMAANDLLVDGDIEADGRIQRYSVDGKKNKKDEWYVAYEGISEKGNQYLICIYYSWSRGDGRFEFKSWEHEDFKSQFGEAERNALQEVMKKRRKEAEKALREVRESSAVKAKEIWESAHTKPGNEEYLKYIKKKGVQATGVRYGKNPNGYDSIIIPLRNIKGEIRSLQFISVGSDEQVYKHFLTGGEKKGNFVQMGQIVDEERFYVAEGYATGASVYEAMNSPVIIAFDSGNLSSVIKNLREKYPKNEIVISADNDESGVGKNTAEQAAKIHGCEVVLPSFSEDKKLDESGKRLTDFNDLHQACGIEEVKKQLLGSSKSNIFRPYSLEDLLKMPEKEWLIENIIGTADVGMLYGPPGAGKTFVAIDMIISACKGREWAGRFKTRRPLNIAYCAGEGLSGLKSRFNAAVLKYEIESPLENFTFFNTMPQLFSVENEAAGETIKNFVREWKTIQEKSGRKPLDILFIDTLHTATVGADENSSKDMGKALHLCRYASSELGCAVVLIHHTNKTGTAERGSSALRGAMDFMIEIGKSSGKSPVSTMSCSKLKDGEQWKKQTFALVPVDETNSVCVDWRSPADSSRSSGKQEEYVESILKIMKENPGTEFTGKEIQRAIGINDNHTRNILVKMEESKDCYRRLKKPNESQGKHNPYLHGIEGVSN